MSTPVKTRLSAQQMQVVNYVDGPLLVVAGPGSGKTRVLTERVRTLLTEVSGHFRVLALTFTNKAADEMRERLNDLSEVRQRAFVGTLHGFCLDMLSERGKFVGVEGTPNIFEQFKDRKEILLKAIADDPLLESEINSIPDSKERGLRVDGWLQMIARIKAHPISCAVLDDEMEQRVLDAYDAGMRACNAYDFDDLLLLTYQLLTNNPKLADFYRRLYRFICIDEAQDLNEAQYAVICALCGETFKNVMLVGDPKQSIYGFNTSSPKYMASFSEDFGAETIELTENFRSSRAVVDKARSLDPNYSVAGQVPIAGECKVMVGNDSEGEAKLIADTMQTLFAQGHADVEGPITPSNCAVLGRTRFALLAVEKELRVRSIPFYRRLTANHENESDAVEDFQLALRLIGNPRDRLHFSALAKRWAVSAPASVSEAIPVIESMAILSPNPCAEVVVAAVKGIVNNSIKLDLMPAFEVLRDYADTLGEEARLAIYEDVEVFTLEWDQYLRAGSPGRSITSFMSSKALGSTQKATREGVGLLTVHAAKGLEFDVVFVAGMAEGVFPDFRARPGPTMDEEKRSAFVAVTRSRRLLYLTYPRMRLMPWGDWRQQSPSRFL
ncbi:DNA helicase-2 / ATP-dependent DNA helicase PcrA [Collimonas sp. OK307]|uniref:ATP-dependent helicase n=1 Tax=Collimonas sp. OK307 TaxID=1801620 RepID=UPI0008E92995|nr:ATP-dependent helicase [Collimonas sp. OK307]SFI48768.1 DNA helicase-2 / ATP-dependent DNA helicase PcrA [Collimonas sp. OK307]